MSRLDIHELNRYQYLFLGGILGEALEKKYIGNYLVENCEELKKLGVLNTTYKTLSSKKSAKENAKTLLEILNNHYQKHKKKIILFAHSKACLEAILAIKENKKVYTEIVEKTILTQPPLKGAPYFNKGFTKVLDKTWPGFSCLTKDYYKNEIEEVLIHDQSLKEYIRKNILVIKGYKDNISDVSWIIKLPFLMCKTLGDYSDGLVRLKDQGLEREYYQTITLNIDHSDLYCSTKLSNISSNTRNKIFFQIFNLN